jgi:hypothetical protein
MSEDSTSEDEGSEIPEHPDGIPYPEGGIQAVEGPDGHQRVTGEAARFIYAGFEEVVKIVVEVTYHDIDNRSRSYRSVLQDQEGGVHLGGGGGEQDWIDLDYGWQDALAKIEDFIQIDLSEDEDASFEIVEGEEKYRQLRAQLN